MKVCVVAFLLTGALGALTPRAAGAARVLTALDEVTVKTDAALDSVTVGQRFHVVYHFSFADSLKPVEKKKLDAGTCRVMDAAWSETKNGNQVERIGDVTFIPMSVDSSVVPANSFDFVSPAGDTLRAWTDDIQVPIKRLAAEAEDLRPLKQQWKAPPNKWLWAGIIALALAAVAALIWWIRSRRAHDGTVVPEIKLPPEVVALAELDRIAGLGLAARGEFKSHYTLVVDAMRRYLEGRYHVETMDRTSFEILEALERRRVKIDGLGKLLDEADLVKFAKFAPEVEDATAAVSRARDIVVATAPVREPVEEEAPPVGGVS